MQYTLIKGAYYVLGYSPDPDSIKFKADNPDLWQQIDPDRQPAFAKNLAADDGIITLRLAGIDGLETHYNPGRISTPKELRQLETDKPDLEKPTASSRKQPGDFGKLATDAFLEMLGVSNVEWKRRGFNTWIAAADVERDGQPERLTEKYSDQIPGYIFANEVERNGRPVAWVFPGETPLPDGSRISAHTLAKALPFSPNYQLVRGGLVYPYFFMNLPAILRQPLANAARIARQETDAQTTNTWSLDHSLDGIELTRISDLTDTHAVFPYLFRKILDHAYAQQIQRYWAALQGQADDYDPQDDSFSLDGLFQDGNPYLFISSAQDFMRLDQVVHIDGQTLRLRTMPDDWVFLY
jgi:hypothetical protein